MSTDWIDLFDKLPDEVLEVILNQLECPEDLASVTKASSICAGILHPKKPVFLFHEVVLKLASYLRKSDLLNFRLVCKQWRTSTDTHLENSKMFMNDEIYFRRNSPFWPRRSRSITDFLSTMQFHHDARMNPFPGRRAAFGRIRKESPDYDYWVNVLRLLDNFGAHLWECRLDFEDIPFERFVAVLSDCLMKTPSLKRLQIVYFGRPSARSDPSAHLTMRNIFPTLPFLEHLELNGTFPSVFYHSVILPNYTSTLKVLKLDQALPEDVVIASMSLLQKLRASACSAVEIDRILPKDSAYLNDISISMHLSEKKDLKYLFEKLHAFRNTLRSLKVSFGTINHIGGLPSHNTSQALVPTFPILTVLKLKNAPLELLDSLESFPSVENLEFECLEKGDTEQENTCGLFNICGYPADTLYSSSIWSTLPCLKSCSLLCYHLASGREIKYKYSRVRFEYLQNTSML